MGYSNKVKLPTAISNRTQLSFVEPHITTGDFLQFQVSKLRELVPTQSIHVDHACFSRLAPLPNPTMGVAEIEHNAFFVPMRTIFPAWNDFITDTPHYHSDNNTVQQVTHVPYIPNNQLVSIFWQNITTNNEYATAVYESDFETSEAADAACDFKFMNYNSNLDPSYTVRGKFTPLGRFAYKLLKSLGISLCFQGNNSDPISLMPLLACAKIYLDYFYPSQYINDGDSSFLNSLTTFDNSSASSYNDKFSSSNISKLFKILYHVPYSDGYFTSAWDNPFSPSDGHYSNLEIQDITTRENEYLSDEEQWVDNKVTNTGVNGTPTIEGSIANTGYLNNLSQYALNALKSLSDYMRRHQIVGSRAMDRFASRFGIQLTSDKLRRCYHLGKYTQIIKFGEVVSTADTEGSELGNYAGIGATFNENGFEFTADEYGYIVITTVIKPKDISYYQGIQRHCNHITKLDFYTPEFDNLGTQAIGAKELFCPVISAPGMRPEYPEKVFGFAPRYAEYKVPYSLCSGDVALNSQSKTYRGWFMFRDIEPYYKSVIGASGMQLEHDINFVLAKDNEQYNRIFYNTKNNADHFIIYHEFTIKSSFPGKSLYDGYQFNDEDKVQKVTVSVGGSNLN